MQSVDIKLKAFGLLNLFVHFDVGDDHNNIENI
jgi:hypothetical protein